MRSALLALALALLPGCDDTLFGKLPSSGEGEGEGEGEGWCGVEAIFEDQCVSCHSGPSGSGGLDLVTDPYAAIVGVESALYAGQILVVAGNADGSLLYHKVAGTQSADQGSAMPLPAGLSAADAATVAAWIDAGASADCSGGTETGETGDTGTTKYHPDGYEAAEVHGLEAKLGAQTCTDCHGADLTGSGAASSCDECHEEGWRTNCTFCHGGTETTGGAPPEDIDGETTTSLLSFPQHTVHVSVTDVKAAFDCDTCHQTPTDVLSIGHVFVDDDTPAVAEVDLSGGLSSAGTWDGATCSNLYCHGDGQGDNGEISITDSIDDCVSCHPHQDSGSAGWSRMSGAHNRHLSEGTGFECGDCHKGVVDMWEPITDVDLHVNGAPDIELVGMMSWDEDAETCTGECHYEEHEARWWYDY